MARKRTLDSPKNREACLAALRADGGTIETASAAVGLGRTAYYDYINSNDHDEAFEADVKAVQEKNHERQCQEICKEAEGALRKLIREGNPQAVIFALKTRGQWKENQKLEVEGDMVVRVKYKDDE